MNDTISLTYQAKEILAFLQKHDREWVGVDLAEITNTRGIHIIMYPLVRCGYVAQRVKHLPSTNLKGEVYNKPYASYILTDAGRAVKIDFNH